MQAVHEVPPDPNAGMGTDIPLEELPPRPLNGTSPGLSDAGRRTSRSSTSSAPETSPGTHDTGSAVPRTEGVRSGKSPVRYFARLAVFWNTKVRCTVDFHACRDHLGTLKDCLSLWRRSETNVV